MKFKDLETALEYFKPIVKESDSPMSKTDWKNDDIDMIELEKKEDEFFKNNYIVLSIDDDDLYFFANDFLVYEIGHSRRGQHYYIICEKSTLELSVIASKPDGDGGAIAIPDILIDLIKNGEIIK